jgi:bacteriorhodopsin
MFIDYVISIPARLIGLALLASIALWMLLSGLLTLLLWTGALDLKTTWRYANNTMEFIVFLPLLIAMLCALESETLPMRQRVQITFLSLGPGILIATYNWAIVWLATVTSIATTNFFS